MEAKTTREMQAALAKPFAPEDLEWRLQNTNEEKMRGMAVPYVTNRAIQNRLDEVCGPENWYNEFKPWHSNGKKDSQLCGIAIHFEGKGFITKWDGAEDSDIEPIKGGLSDSMKRAAYQWGIGRVLYSLDTVWVDIERRGKSYVIKDSERRKLDNAYLSTLESLGLEPAKACGIQSLLTPKTASEQNTANDKVPPITHGQEPQQAKSGSAQPVPRAQEHPAQSPAAPAQTQRTQPPAQDRSDGQGGKTVSFGGATQIAPAIELYTVLGAKVQGGMSGSNTLVNLETPEKKQLYRWLSSRGLPNGTRSYSWVHVTGDSSRKRAFLTEGPLKGDVASFLAGDELFLCIGGVNALHGLTDTIRELGVREVVEAMDMDQMTNPNVRKAVLTMRKEVQKIPGIRYAKYTWNPAYKGVDDYLLSRAATM